MAKLAIPRNEDREQIVLEVLIAGATHRFKLHIGPGDMFAPFLTLMLPHQG